MIHADFNIPVGMTYQKKDASDSNQSVRDSEVICLISVFWKSVSQSIFKKKTRSR